MEKEKVKLHGINIKILKPIEHTLTFLLYINIAIHINSK